MQRRKGHSHLTVFADLVQKRVVFATNGKDSGPWERFAAEPLPHNGHAKAVTQVVIGMSAAYAKGVREDFGNVRVVYDEFHVVRKVVEVCDRLRKTESRLNAESQERLERSRWLWRRNPENWTAKEAQRREAMAKKRGAPGLAYEMRAVLADIDRSPGAREARQRFKNWCAWAYAMSEEIGELLESMVAVAHMMETHIEGILAHWKQGLTAASMEGLNSLFSAVKRKARSYPSVEYMITRLYVVAGELRLRGH